MYQKITKSWIKHIDFIILDMIVIQFSLMLAYWFRHGIHLMYNVPVYRQMSVYLFLIDLIVMFFNESYRGILRRGYLVEFKAVLKHITYVILLGLLYLFLLQEGEIFSRSAFLMMWAISIVLTWTVRVTWKNYLKIKKRDKVSRSMIVITAKSIAESCLESLADYNYEPFKVMGICIMDDDLTGETIRDIPVIANEDTILEYIKCHWVDEVFINLPKEIPLSDKLIQGCNAMGVTVHLNLMKLGKLNMENQVVERIGGYTVLSSSINIATERQAFLKRMMDIAGGLVGSIMTILFMIVIGPIIYIKSPGPIFFSQERIGRNGKKFKMYKFRSMYMDAEERKKELMDQNEVKDGMMFKMENDPRIIGGKNGKKGIGHFIRSTSIDEFPQFFNILKGDMSLVGTRPPTIDEWEKYELHHRARMSAKPGLTGLWQVSGRSDIQDFEEVVALDTSYIQKWTLGLDIKILFRTVGVVLKKEGSR